MHGRLEKCSICISLHYPRSDGLKMLTWSIASLIHYKGCCSVIVDKSVAGKSNCTYTNHISCLQCMEIGNKWHGILCYTSCQGSQSDNVLWRLRYALLPRRQGVTRPLRCLGYALSLRWCLENTASCCATRFSKNQLLWFLSEIYVGPSKFNLFFIHTSIGALNALVVFTYQ